MRKMWVVNLVFATLATALLLPSMISLYPTLVGAENIYTVMSGSMSPTLYPGDLVIVKVIKPEEIKVGDVLTVKPEETVYTHRVVEKLEGETYFFRLKGDANEEPDPRLIESSQIVGKVFFIFPFSHLYTPYGFAAALLVPAALIIGKQAHTIHQSTKRRNRIETMRWRRKSHSALDTGTLLLALILTVSTTRIIAPHFISGSSSYFSDTEWATGFFRAGIWEVGALVDIKPDTLNLESEGEWVTVYAIVDTEYDEKDIIVESVMLDGVIHAEWGEVQTDGRLMVKFDRALLIEYLIGEGYGDGDEVTLTVSGEFVDGVKFSGTDTIVVIGGG